MKPLLKRAIPKVAGALVRGPLKRLMDRRAAKGGPVVTWWRRTFGEIDGDAAGGSMEKLAQDYVDELEKSGRLQRE